MWLVDPIDPNCKGSHMNTKKQIANLAKMKLNELQAKYAEVFGKETRSHNKAFLIRKITEALQAAGGAPREKSAGPSAHTTTETAGATASTPHVAAITEQTPEALPEKSTEKMPHLTVPELQTLYLEVVGRSTGSSNSAYLIWKIREARKGRIPIGPRKSDPREEVTFKVLPLRLEAAVVDKLDESWKRQGLKSRTELFRKSLHLFLRTSGEDEVAALLTDVAGGKQ
jgi:hypothetical protein